MRGVVALVALVPVVILLAVTFPRLHALVVDFLALDVRRARSMAVVVGPCVHEHLILQRR